MADDTATEVSFSANLKNLFSGLKEASAGTKVAGAEMAASFGVVGTAIETVQKHWMGLTALIAGGALFKEALSGTIAWTGEVVQLSNRLGITTMQASGLAVSLKHAGLTSDEYGGMVNKLTRQMRSNEDAFESLGIATKKQNGEWQNSQTVMAAAIEKLNAMQSGTDRNIAAQALFGGRVGDLTALLRLNGEMLEEGRKKAEQYHLIVGPDGAAKALQYRYALADVKLITESLTVQIGNALLPIFLNLTKVLGSEGPAAQPGFHLVQVLLEATRDRARVQAHHRKAGFWSLHFQFKHGIDSGMVDVGHHHGAHTRLLGAAQGIEPVGLKLFGVEVGVRIGNVHFFSYQ